MTICQAVGLSLEKQGDKDELGIEGYRGGFKR